MYFLGLGWKLNLCNLDIDKRGVSNMGHPNPPWSGHIIVPVEKTKQIKNISKNQFLQKRCFFKCFFITRRSFSRSVTVFSPWIGQSPMPGHASGWLTALSCLGHLGPSHAMRIRGHRGHRGTTKKPMGGWLWAIENKQFAIENGHRNSWFTQL